MVDPSPIVIEDEDDNLSTILARIQKQEDSENLVRQLQDEWNRISSPSNSAIVIDEALAKLDEQWTRNDQNPKNPTHSETRSYDHTSGAELEVLEVQSTSAVRRSAPERLSMYPTPADVSPPDERLDAFRQMFTVSRNCTKCEGAVHSPRSYVRDSPTFRGVSHLFSQIH